MSGALHASCCVTSKKVSFEHDKFRIDIESPIDVTMPPAHTLTEANDTSLTKTVVNRHPDNNCLGTFTCRLLDKSTGTYVEEISNNLTELPSEFTTLLPELTTKSQPIIRSIQRFNLWLIIVICIFGVISIIITAFIFLKIRHNRSSVPECVTSSLNFVVGETNAAYLHEELCNLQYDTRFEVDETNLMRLECIGGGHFSTVFNGKFKVSQQWPANNQFMHYLTPSSSLAVAIKVPGDEDGLCDIIACQNMLHDELKILCSVRSHPNIVTLVGAVTKADNSMCIIVEKCTNGSLLNFLKSRRETFIPQFKNELTKTETHIYPSKPKNILSNGLSTAHLISFSLQVALGMNHLTSMKCLHRDLAARNVLITDKLVCKIADFGLAKRVNRKDYYRVTTNYDLPVRWMSPETITSLTSTIESDIWSYGIVLYEIFTLGGCPYPTVSNPDVMEAIRNGRLNERPEFCPSAIYSHMLNCWNAYPGQRPSFANSAELLNKELFLASPQVLNTVEKELSREKHRQAELESLRSRSYVR